MPWSGGISTNLYCDGGSTFAISSAKFSHAYDPHESSDHRNPPLSRYLRMFAASASLKYSDSAGHNITNPHRNSTSSVGLTMSGRDSPFPLLTAVRVNSDSRWLKLYSASG